MTKVALALLTPEQFPMASGLPKNFVEEQIIYRKVKIDTGDFGYRYKKIDRPTPVATDGSYTGIEDFVRQIALRRYRRNDRDNEERKRLDIPLSKPSYVIIELTRKVDLWFSDRNPAITLGRYTDDHPDPSSLYGCLRHVDISGNIHSEPAPRCRLAYFAAMPHHGSDTDPFEQPLNYNVQSPGGVTIVIDPDIRHPGTGNG